MDSPRGLKDKKERPNRFNRRLKFDDGEEKENRPENSNFWQNGSIFNNNNNSNNTQNRSSLKGDWELSGNWSEASTAFERSEERKCGSDDDNSFNSTPTASLTNKSFSIFDNRSGGNQTCKFYNKTSYGNNSTNYNTQLDNITEIMEPEQ